MLITNYFRKVTKGDFVNYPLPKGEGASGFIDFCNQNASTCFCLTCEYVPYTHKVMFKGFTRRTVSLLNHNTSKNLTQRYKKKMKRKIFNKKLTNELTSPTLKG
jgi:hypothetical protein